MKQFIILIFTSSLSFSQLTTSSIREVISDETNVGFAVANVIAFHRPPGTTL